MLGIGREEDLFLLPAWLGRTYDAGSSGCSQNLYSFRGPSTQLRCSGSSRKLEGLGDVPAIRMPSFRSAYVHAVQLEHMTGTARTYLRPMVNRNSPTQGPMPQVVVGTQRDMGPQARHPTNQKGLLTTGTSFWMDERRIAPGPVAKSPVQGWPAPGTHSATRPAARQRATAHRVTNVKTPHPPTREVRVGKLKTVGRRGAASGCGIHV